MSPEKQFFDLLCNSNLSWPKLATKVSKLSVWDKPKQNKILNKNLTKRYFRLHLTVFNSFFLYFLSFSSLKSGNGSIAF